MTFDEPEVSETAMAAALRAAGHDPVSGRLEAILNSTRGQPMKRQKKFMADRAAWILYCAQEDGRRASSAPPSAAPARATPAPRRNLIRDLRPAAAERALRNIEKIGNKAVLRFLADYGDISFGSIDAHLRDSFVLRRIKEHYAGTRPEMLLKDVVRTDVLARFIAEAGSAVAA